jgi:hypothetical protein
LLNADEFKRGSGAAVFLQTQLDNLTNALHQCIEVLGLGMATPQGRDGSDIVPIFIALD